VRTLFIWLDYEGIVATPQLQINTLKSLFDLLYLKYRGNILFVTPMETVDAEHIQLYEDIDAKNFEQAQKVLGQHISNVKKHAILSIERMNREKNSKFI